MKFKQLDHKEILLRSLFVLLIIGLILGNSMNILLIAFNIKKPEANAVLLSMKTLDHFPVWPSFLCGQGLTGVVAKSIKRGKSGVSDVISDLPVNYIRPASLDDLTPGNWTESADAWPCYVFNTFRTLNFTPGEIDQVVLVASGQAVNNPTGLLFGIFDAVRNMSSIEPFVAPIPSRNTFTFTKNERHDVNGNYLTYFFVNKQNTVSGNPPAINYNVENVVATFAYSPDTYIVTDYREQKSFTPYGLISSVGGLITYAVAAWVILFGRGKYRSWGLIQRYLLRNSPDSTKNDSKNRLFVSSEKLNDVESQTHLVVPSPRSDDKTFRPTSEFYFNPNQPNFNPMSSPNSVVTVMSQPNSIQSKDLKDLNKLIDAKINQKLWFVEQTLSRHYLAGFRLRKYDIDPNKLGTSYDGVGEVLTPPIMSHPNSPPQPPPKSISPYNSQIFPKNNNSVSSFNPEEQRSQYPNVAIGQIPFEKKQRGSENFQYLSTSSNEVVTGNNPSNTSLPMTQSSYSPNVPIQLPNAPIQLPYNDNSNLNPQLQTSLPQGSHMSFNSSQSQNQGGPGERW